MRQLNKHYIPEGITALLKGIFAYCNLLTSVVFPNTLTAVSDEAFSGSGLTGLNIPDTITKIGAISGTTEIEERDHNRYNREWINVTVYDALGNVYAQMKTTTDRTFSFTGLPLSNYSIVAEAMEIRPHKKHEYDRSVNLKGYGYVEITEATLIPICNI